MELLRVNQERCKRDGICASECPTRVIKMPSPGGNFPKSTADADEYCLACGHCVAVCPAGALSLDWLAPQDCPDVRQELVISAEQAEHFLRSRRSIRTFKEQPIERKKLEKLLEIACYAPSAKNKQPWHWLVVEKSAEVRRLAGMVIEWMRGFIEKNRKLAEGLGFVRVVGEWDRGDERICRGAPHIIVVHGNKGWPFGIEDCTLALDYVELYALTLGLGTCWGGYFYTAINQYPPLFEVLGLPSDHKAYGAMMVGYPRFEYRRLPRRNPPKVTWR